LSSDLNELCGQDLVLAHHGAIARERRVQIEEALKNGQLRGLVATSTLELGIDMGAIDLVVQIEAPPSVASGLQRIGRAGHSVGGVSKGIIYPKFRGDLLAAAATVDEMRRGQVEAQHFPRNPLDVLAQQVVAIVSMGEINKNELLGLVRGAAPLSQLSETSFDSVIDMLSGRYPSDAFAELRPRINWDRTTGMLSAHKGARHLALINGGTIADRGLYGVFLAGDVGKGSRRVGELDEEMVFESRIGDVFLLGASSWRIEDITPDRVLVTPAPGEPGRMPFWHGDRAGRPLSLGKAVGALARELDEASDEQGCAMLTERGLAQPAAENLVAYLREERAALGQVPSDRQIIVECFLDELGDYRVCVLSPFGSRVHAPWAIAAMQLQSAQLNTDTQAVWFDDGIVFRFPRAKVPALSLLIPDPLELDELLQNGLASSALFASHFRESAARALLLPRRMPGRRTPLWAQRRRSAELLRAASEYPDFPIVLETMRECLSDVFDVSGLREMLGALARGEIGAHLVQTATPSPFAAALLFNYAGNFMYSGDAPLAERRAQALTVNQSQLRDLLGELELRHLLDPDAIAEVEREVGRRNWVLSGADDVHDLLAAVGDLEASELERWNGDAECDSEPVLVLRPCLGVMVPRPLLGVVGWLATLEKQKRVVELQLGGKRKYIAAEDARRYCQLVELKLPADFPPEFLEPLRDPVGDLVARFARTHGPFRASRVVRAYPLREDTVVDKLRELERQGRVTSGYFLPGGTGIEWCDVEVLRRIKQRSLARLRQRVKPVKAEVYARCLIEWQGATQPRRGLDVLPAVLEQLQGAPLVVSALEKEVLAARVAGYHPSELDALILSGEFLWSGIESLGQFDGRIALYPRQEFALLAPTPEPVQGALTEAVRQQLRQRGASFFDELVAATGSFAPELLEAIWSLVWSGEVTNDSLGPLRSRLLGAQGFTKRRPERFYSRRQRLAGSEGRWSLLERWRSATPASPTERLMLMARTLLNRYGVLPSEAFAHESFASFSEVYPVLKELEQAGKVRRGYFVDGLAATQFAEPGADDRLRVLRETNPPATALVLAATDPANPYGAILPWPDCAPRPQRAALARVVIYDGRLVAYVSRTGHSVQTFLPDHSAASSEDHEEIRPAIEQMIAQALVHQVDSYAQRSFEIKEINGGRARDASFGQSLVTAGFVATSDGYFYVGGRSRAP